MGVDGAKIMPLGDLHRQWKLTFRTRLRFEKETGQPLETLMNQLATITETAGVWESIATLIWAGLAEFDKEITLDEVFDALPFYPIDQVRVITESYMEAMERGGSQNGDTPLPLEGQTIGVGSGPSGDMN